MNETTVRTDYSTSDTLYLAFELGQEKWKLGFTSGVGQPVWKRVVPGGDVLALGKQIGLAKQRFGLSERCRVVSCYEAGRDGFWLHRWLLAEGIENRVVDSASIEVNRRAKRAKTDRLDVEKLVTMLVRFEAGEKKVWSVVHVPSPEVEDQRHLHRELHTLKVDRTRHVNRIKGCWPDRACACRCRPTSCPVWMRCTCGTGRPCRPGCGLAWNRSMPA